MLNEEKVVPKLRQEVKVKVDIVTSDDIKTYSTGKFQDFTARYIIRICFLTNMFSLQREMIIAPLFREITTISTNNLKIDIKGILVG